MTTNEIKELQAALKIPQTGEYDDFTEAAVRNFQSKNNLKADGIVGNNTREILLRETNLGNISSDLMETSSNSIKTYLLKKDEYFTTDEPKEWLFLHHTAGFSNPYATVNDWESDTRGKVGTQYLIGGRHLQTLDAKYDGEIVQCMPSYKNYGWHLGIGNTKVHRASIGVEVCNFGWLVKDGNDFKTYVSLDNSGKIVKGKGPVVNPKEVCDLKSEFRGKRYFHAYTEAQILSLKYLIQKIGKETGIDVTLGLKERLKTAKDPFTAFDYDPNVVSGKVKGLFCHTHVSPKNKWGHFEKWDLYPSPIVIEMITSL